MGHLFYYNKNKELINKNLIHIFKKDFKNCTNLQALEIYYYIYIYIYKLCLHVLFLLNFA